MKGGERMEKLYLRQGAMLMAFATRPIFEGMRVHDSRSMLDMYMGEKRYAAIVRDKKYR